MKNLYKLSAILIATCILFSSCESNFSITKRHYKSGYYINYTRSNKGAIPKVANNNTAQIATTTPTSIQQSPRIQNNLFVNPILPGKEKKQLITVRIKKVLPKTTLQQITKQSLLNVVGIINVPVMENTPALSQSPSITNNVSDGDRGERAALSLLWLVIVIVLILWLIGLIAGGFGLGGLINLLLVVALILLILWLLRVI